MLRIKFTCADIKIHLRGRRDFSTLNSIFSRENHVQLIIHVETKWESCFHLMGHRCQVAIQHSLKISLPSSLKRSYKQRKIIQLWVVTSNISSIVHYPLLRIFLKMVRHVDLGTRFVRTESVRTEWGQVRTSWNVTLFDCVWFFWPIPTHPKYQ